MKKILIIIAAAFITSASFAQKGMEVVIKQIPDKMEILPGLYELFGNVVNSTEFSYVLTTNDELVEALQDSAKAGKPIYFLGPKLEQLAQEKCIRDYAEKRRKIEKDASDSYNEAKEDTSTSAQERRDLKKEWKDEVKNTKDYLKQLGKIVLRYNTNCIYAYNSSTGAGTASKAAEPKKSQGGGRIGNGH